MVDQTITNTWTLVAKPAILSKRRELGLPTEDEENLVLPTETIPVPSTDFDYKVHADISSWRHVCSLNVPSSAYGILTKLKIFVKRDAAIKMEGDEEPWNIVDSVSYVRLVVDNGGVLSEVDVEAHRKQSGLADTVDYLELASIEWKKGFPICCMKPSQSFRVYIYGNGRRHLGGLLKDEPQSKFMMYVSGHNLLDASMIKQIPFKFTCMHGLNVFFHEPEHGFRTDPTVCGVWARHESLSNDEDPMTALGDFESGPDGPADGPDEPEGSEGSEERHPPGALVVQVPMSFLKSDGTFEEVGIEVASELVKDDTRDAFFKTFGERYKAHARSIEEEIMLLRKGLADQYKADLALYQMKAATKAGAAAGGGGASEGPIRVSLIDLAKASARD